MRAQVVDKSLRVDTLTLKERVALRTNAVDWALLIPNIGVEFDLRSESWNRWTVGLNVRGNWQTSHTYKPGLVYNLFGVRAEVRNYWRLREYNDYVRPQTGFLDKLFSARRHVIKHPLNTYYKGAYLSYDTFSLMFGSEGRQGSALTLGFTIGMVKPLFIFPNGNSLDIDMGVAAGLAYAKADKYRLDRESNCYPVTEQGKWGLVPIPVLSEARVALVYRLGNFPITRKYRFRYDCDMPYRERVDSIARERKTEIENRHNADSIGKIVLATFEHAYDSIAKINAHRADSLNNKVRKQKVKTPPSLPEGEGLGIADSTSATTTPPAAAEAAPSPSSEETAAPVSEEATPAADVTPAEEAAPAADVTPTEEAAPAADVTPAEEATPAADVTPAEATTPSSEEVPSATPASPTVPTEEAPSPEGVPAEAEPTPEPESSPEATPSGEAVSPSGEEATPSSEAASPSDTVSVLNHRERKEVLS